MTQRLVDYALSSEFRHLPATAVHECKRHPIDTFACAIGAYDEPFCARARGLAARYTGTPAASVWGSSEPVSAEMAAFANGVMLRYLDLNDMYRVKSGGHPSDIIAGILATGEAVHADGPAVISAIVLGYEIYCGACEALDFNSLGWDQPLYGVIATALAAGRLMGLDREGLGNALALALVPNMPLFQTRRGELSGWKGCAGANACRNGVFAALLARDGFDGPTAAFEGKFGLCDAVGKFAWPEFGGETIPYRRPLCHIKRYPVCYHGQGAVQIASELHSEIDAERIAEISIETYRIAAQEMGNDPSRWAPRSRETADHSLPYVTAVALLDGDVTPLSFASERLQDERIGRLMALTKVLEDSTLSALHPECAPTRIRLQLKDGTQRVKEVQQAAGHSRSPLSDAEIEAKFRALFKGYGPQSQCDAALAALWAFDAADDVGAIVHLLAKG
jgi:2-methylcitrate dehydratase